MSLLVKLAKVKSELGKIKKDANNPFFRSKYADLNTHLEEVEPLIQKHGLILLQPCSIQDGKNVVSTLIIDPETGDKVESTMQIIGDLDMQKLGSGVSYGRRYTLGSLLSMQAVDDDAETTMQRSASKKQETKKFDKLPAKGEMDF